MSALSPSSSSAEADKPTFETIYDRRAVKHFDPSHEIPLEDLTRMLEAAIQAPTSFNIPQWRFVHVTDPALRQAIRAAAWDQP